MNAPARDFLAEFNAIDWSLLGAYKIARYLVFLAALEGRATQDHADLHNGGCARIEIDGVRVGTAATIGHHVHTDNHRDQVCKPHPRSLRNYQKTGDPGRDWGAPA